jgi:hypothetical protein
MDIAENSQFKFPVQRIGPMETGETLSETFMNEVNRIREQAMEWQDWAISEIAYWKDRCQELETELMLTREQFFDQQQQHEIWPKRYGMLRAVDKEGDIKSAY